MPANMSAISIPPVSQEFINGLSVAFPLYQLTPGFNRDEAMQSCGEQRVIEWIKAKALQGRTVTGDIEAVRDTNPTGAIVRYGS